MTENYLYTTRFEDPVYSCVLGDSEFISKASLENLKPLISKDIDFSTNIDLLGLAFNAAVVNMFNKNDDGMDSATAAEVIRNFIHKPTNIEHDKSKIVGHLTSAGFSQYGEDNKMLQLEDVLKEKNPFNISLGAVVYKYANKPFTSMLERSINPADSLYQRISTSWEVGFSAYDIAVGSVNLGEAEIITNAKHIEELRPKLKAYKGSGKLDDGTRIYRLLRGTIYPLGIGFTTTPAANVKGLYSDPSSNEGIEIKDKRDRKYFFDIKNLKLNKKSNEAISQIALDNVKNKNGNIMEIEKVLSELNDMLIEKKFSTEAVANMTETFAEAIRQKDSEYRETIAKAEKEKTDIAQERETLKASVEAMQQQLSDAVAKIGDFESMKEQEQAIARFNSRMDSIDQSFELDDEDRRVLADDLKSLDASDEAFAAYKAKVDVMFKHKSKEAKAARDKAIQDKIEEEVTKRIAKASFVEKQTDKQIAEEAFAKAQETSERLPNSNEETSKKTPSLREKFASAFTRENIIIS